MEEDILKAAKKRKIITLILTIVSISLMIGSFSYAWLNGVFTSTNTVSITAGNLNIVYNESNNLISLPNELPKLDEVAIANNPAHTFTLTNDGTENVGYAISLQNICVVDADIDMCVPNTYMKAAIKVDSANYVTKSLGSTDLIATGTITPGQIISFSLKIWLDQTTPNMYNPAMTTNNIVYQSKIVLRATQQLGTLVSNITISLSDLSVAVGSSINGYVEVEPNNVRDGSVSWSSSDLTIATVDASGVITGISEGTVHICATANDGGNAYDCEEVIVLSP